MMTKQRHNWKIGKVTGKFLSKTIRVTVERVLLSPRTKRKMVRKKVFLVHDENNQAKVGDQVLIWSSRYFSKKKHYFLKEIQTNQKQTS